MLGKSSKLLGTTPGVTRKYFVEVTPSYVALIATEVGTVTARVETANVAEKPPVGMKTCAGILTMEVLPLSSVIVAPPAGAASNKSILAVAEAPPTKSSGDTLMPSRLTG